MSRMQERLAALTDGNTLSTQDMVRAAARAGDDGSASDVTRRESPDLESRISLG